MTAVPTPHRLSVAPMMDWTDRHDRFFLRLITHHTRLYTEMITTGALIHGDRDRLLRFDAAEHPVALQVGGSVPDAMARAAELAEAWGYDEVNINVGCPSDRVQSGRFGACLMAEPATVAACVAAMRRATALPVTVKCRIGIDDQQGYAPFRRFIDTVAEAGCGTFIVHARKAWLKGLSPKENREIPPLDYSMVARLKADRPDLTVVLNGGVKTLAEAEGHLEHVDGVMIGRAAYQTPMVLAEADRRLFDPTAAVPDPVDVVRRFLPYVDAETRDGTPLIAITRHILGAFHAQPGGRQWRRHLSENAPRKGAGVAVVEDALALVLAARTRKEQRLAA